MRSTSCATCHKDVHLGQVGTACENCHTVETKFAAINFPHTKASFQLTGKHAPLSCEACHRDIAGATAAVTRTGGPTSRTTAPVNTPRAPAAAPRYGPPARV